MKKAPTRPSAANLSKIAYEFFVTCLAYKKGGYASKRKFIWIRGRHEWRNADQLSPK